MLSWFYEGEGIQRERDCAANIFFSLSFVRYPSLHDSHTQKIAHQLENKLKKSYFFGWIFVYDANEAQLMKTIYLIRHAEKEIAPGDPGLTEHGHEQARKTAQYLKKHPITYLSVSPLLRTQQTAAHIAQHLNLEPEINEFLRERINWGDQPDQSFEEFSEMWKKTSLDRDFQPQVGDSSREAGLRLHHAMNTLLGSTDHEHLAIVTHGGVIGDFLRNVFDEMELANKGPEISADNNFRIPYCSITTLGFDGKKFTLKKLADANHLA